jgi:hypothetical protein
MPRITINADLGDPEDLANAANFASIVARAAASGKLYGEIEAEDRNAAETAETAETVTQPTEPETTPVEPKKRSKAAPKDILVYNHLGEKLAGFTHSEMAAARLTMEAEKITVPADLQAFAHHNMASFSRLAKDDAEALTKAITKHANAIRNPPAAEKQPDELSQLTDKIGLGAVAEAMGETEVELNDDAALASAFGAPADADVPAMSKSDFGKAFVKIGTALGPHEATRWLKAEGFEDPTAIPASEYARLVALGEAHVASLTTKA